MNSGHPYQAREDGTTVTLLSGDERSSVTIYKFGATVVSWKNEGIEQLLLSSLAVLDGSKAIRGGIPLVFPQFSQPNKAMPQHGVARTAMWSLVSLNASADAAVAVLQLRASNTTRALWPHDFLLTYTVTLGGASLRTELKAENIDSAPFECQMLLHTYLRVADIAHTTVRGFCGKKYIDKLDAEQEKIETDETAVIDREVDRIYSLGVEDVDVQVLDANRPVQSLTSTAQIQLADGTVRTAHPDCVLWNAWVEKSRALADLDDDAYLRYVCVEPGLVLQRMSLGAGESATLTQVIRALS